jgi:hypothetical protein
LFDEDSRSQKRSRMLWWWSDRLARKWTFQRDLSSLNAVDPDRVLSFGYQPPRAMTRNDLVTLQFMHVGTIL